MPQHELNNDLPAYLVYLILANVHRLREVSPDHILVKAVEDALDKLPHDNPEQMCFEDL